MAGKYWWEEDEKQSNTQTTTQSNSQTGKKYWWEEDAQQSSGKGYWWDDGSTANTVGNNITNRVNTWLKNHNNYVSNYKNRNAGRKYTYEDAYVSDSGSWLDTISKQKSNFDAEADNILAYMDQNKGYLDADWVKSVRDTLTSAREQQNLILENSTKDNEWWSNFGSEELVKAYGSAKDAYEYYQRDDAYRQKYSGKKYEDIQKALNTLQDGEEKDWLDYYQYDMYEGDSAYTSKAMSGLKSYEAQRVAQKQKEDDKSWWEEVLSSFANAPGDTSLPMGEMSNVVAAYRNDNSWREPNDKWSDGQRREFGYRYAEDPAKAFDYAERVNHEINIREEYAQQQAIGDAASKDFWSGALHTAGAIATAPLGLADYLNDLAQANGRGTIVSDGVVSPFEYSQAAQSGIANKLNAVDENGVAQNVLPDWVPVFGGKGWGDVYSLGVSAANSLVSAYTLGGTGTLVNFMGQGGAAGVDDALSRGATVEQALLYGTIVGAAEGITEQFSVDKLIKVGSSSTLKNYLLKALGQGLGEAAEEGASAIIGNVADNIIMGSKSNFHTMVKEYMADGLSEEDAKAKAWDKLIQGSVFDALGGFATGAGNAMMVGGVSTALDARKGNQKNIDAVKQYGEHTDALIQEGLESDVNSESYQLAQKYQQQVQGKDGKQGKAMTGFQIRNLVQANDAQIAVENYNEALPKATEMLKALGETKNLKKVADLVAKRVSGQALEKSEKSYLARSQYGAQVAKELMTSDQTEGGAKAFNATYKSITERVGEDGRFGVSESGQATIRDTDKAFDITKAEVVEVGEGQITFKTDDGEEVSAGYIDFADEDQSFLVSAVSDIENITPAAATAVLRDVVDTSKPLGEQLNGIDEAYTYGYHGYSVEDMKAGNFAPKLSNEQMMSAYVLGQNAKKLSGKNAVEGYKKMRTAAQALAEKAATEGKAAPKAKKLAITYNHGDGVIEDIATADKKLGKLNDEQRGGIEAAKILHQMGIGTDFELFSSYYSKTLKDKNGNPLEVFLNDEGQEQAAYAGVYMAANGKIRINLNAYSGTRGLTLNALSHELTHFIKTWSLEKYEAMAEFLVKSYGENGVSMNQLVLKEQARLKRVRGKEVSYSEAYDEVVANAFNRMLEDGKVMERIAEIRQVDKSLADKILECIRKFIQRFKDVYQKNQSLFDETEALMEMKEVFEQLQNMFAEALVDASDNFQASLIAKEAGLDVMPVEDSTQYSYQSLAEAAGFTAVENENGTRSFVRDGKAVSEVTVDDIENSPIGAFINFSVEMKDISPADAKRQKEMFAEICTMACKTNDFAMTMQFVGSAVFTGMKANADKQYGTTYDFPSICTKTQAVIDAMSAKMVSLGRGLNTDEIVQLYADVFASGNPVPCPECYVFSRWIGIGGLLDNIKKYQDYYGDMAVEDVADAYRKMKAEVSKFADEQGISFGKAKGALTSKLTKEFNKLTEKIEKAQNQGEKVKPADLKRLEELEPMMNTVKAMTWLENVYFADSSLKKVNPKFRVPNEVLFDLNNGEAFASQYKDAWAFRTTQGAGYGKAITPYAEARLGEGVLVTNNTTNAIKGRAQGTLNNYFLNQKGKLDKQSRDALKRARMKQKIQAFIGGQRFQSTSDARYENASDYLLAALEMQAMAGMVQAYTKVDGAIPAFSAWGFSSNQSLMPLNGGLDADGNVQDTPVGGMNPKVAFENRKKHESAGTITIGVNDNHIRAMFKQWVRDFIIPYHASGGKADVVAEFRRIQEGKEAKGKAVRSTDYSRTQSDKILSDEVLRWQGKTDAQIQRIHEVRNARIAILTGGKVNMTVVRSNRFLSALYDKLNGGEWDGVKLAKSKVESQIFPNEFWDQTVTYEESAKITKDYLEYCEDLGFLHRFSGMVPSNGKLVPVNGYNENGERVQLTDLAYKYDENGNKTAEVEEFFWKVLTDRRMYDNNGNYLAQKVVTLNDTTTETVTGFAKNNQGRQYDKAKAEELAQKILKGEQYSSQETDFAGDFDYSELNWARDLGIITVKDQAIFERTINNEIRRGAKPHTANGEYIIDTGKCLMFTDGDFHNPTLSRVIVFATEYESLTADAKEMIINEAKATGEVQNSLSAIERMFGQGFASLYNKPDGRAYAGQNRGGKGSNRSGTAYKAKSLKERLAEEGKEYLLYSSQETDLGNAPTFYSQMGKVVEGMKHEKFGASSVISMLRGRGVKAEEIRWSGIQAFLDGKKSVTKAELLAFINSSMLQIQETVLDGRPAAQSKLPDNYRLEETADDSGEPILNLYIDDELVDTFEQIFDGSISSTGDSEIWAMNEADLVGQILNHYAGMSYDEAYGTGAESNGPKWGDYKLHGGENYRELVFKMPGSTYTNNAMRGHWGDDAQGVLAHARMQDFEVDGNKMLFIEEIQSDWHNAGHKSGYVDKDIEKKLAPLESAQFRAARERVDMYRDLLNDLTEFYRQYGMDTPDVAAEKHLDLSLSNDYQSVLILSSNRTYGFPEDLQVRLDRYFELEKEENDLARQMRKAKNGVPDAPFHSNYHEFVLKRLIRMAAEEGYDSIGWTTADIQSDRWSDDYAEGYRIEYDQDIPKFLKKYGKQWGAEVGKTPLPGLDASETYYDVNREETFANFNEWKNVVLAQLKRDGVKARDVVFEKEHGSGDFIAYDDHTGTEYDRAKVNKRSGSVWSMDITPAMKKSVLTEGQAMYSSQETDLDSEGKKLTKEQQEFFKDSKVRDEHGRLIRVFHGSETGGFTVFGNSHSGDAYWFADKTTAESYIDVSAIGEEHWSGKGKTSIYEVYLNAKNPLVIDADGYRAVSIPTDIFPEDGGRERFHHIDDIAFYALDNGYDGLIVENVKDYGGYIEENFGADSDSNLGTGTVYSVFKPEQIKNVDNTTPTSDPDIRYSTQETDNITNRHLLANAFEGITQNSVEYKMLQDYKSRIKELNELEAKLSDLNAEIRKIRFGTEGRRDAQRLTQLEDEAKKVAKEINRYDKRLLSLEASEPLRKVIERERKKEAQKTKDHVKEIQQNKKVRAEQTELRHKIRKAIRDLDKILKHGNKQKNVKEDLQPVVTKALQAAEILFTDNFGTYDMLRSGIKADLSDSEEALVNTCTQMLKDLDKMPTDGYDNWQARQEAENRLKTKMSKLQDVFARERKRLNNTTVSSILGELADAYASLENSQQSYVQGAYSEAVHNFLKNLHSEVGGAIVKDMTKDQLESVYAAYKMVLMAVRTANQMFNEGLKMSREQLANAVIQEVTNAGGVHGLWTKSEIARSQADWNNTKPIWVANRIGSETFGKLMNGLFKGQYNFAVDIEEAKKFKLKMDEKYHPRTWDAEKLYEFESSTGKKFSLNLQQIMSLYAFSKREQAYSHLLNGGFVFESNSTVVVDKKGIKRTYLHDGATSYKLNEATLNGIINSLTKEQKAYVDDMQKYLSEVMGAKGNEVSMKLYGIQMFKEKFYFPLRSSGAYMEKAKAAELKKEQGQINLVNSGFTHAVKPEAKNPIILAGFMDVWAEHCNEMSMYHSMVLPMEDFRKVYNYSTVHDDKFDSASVYQTIQDAYGKAATAYIDQLYRELNAGATVDPRETPFKARISKFKKAAVMLSASVVFQQFSSVGRAYALIDPKYFIGTRVNSDTKLSVVGEMKKYAPVAIIKEMGGFDTGTKGSAKSYIMAETYGKGERIQGLLKDEQFRSDIMGYLPAKADEKTWCAIWEAVKRETKAKHPKMDVKSEEFLKLVGERFSEVIEKTQVYDSVLARSANMRSKSAFMAMATSFMAEPTTTINLLEDAIRSGNKKQIARTFGAVAVAIVLNNALASVVYAMRDDDEDETFIEKYFQSFASGMIDDLNPMSYYPFLKDVYSLFQGYDVERSDMSVIADLRDALKKAISVIGKDTSEMDDDELAEHWKNVNGVLMSLLDAGCSVFGVPVKNVRRDANGIINAWNTISKDVSGERNTTWMSFWDKVGSAAKDTIPIYAWTKDKAKVDKLYDAIISGDKSYVARLKATYKDDDAYTNAVRKVLRENDPRIHEAAQARYDGNIAECKRIYQEIKKEGKFNPDDIMEAIYSEEAKIRNALKPDTESSEHSATDFVNAVIYGETSMAQAMKDEIIATKVANGKTQEEAEESFFSSVSTSIKNAFNSELLDEAGAEKMLTEYAGKDATEAAEKVSYWAFCKAHPEHDFTESNVKDYREFAEPAEITLDVYAQFITGTKGLETKYDKWGDVEVSKREQVLEVINSLPLTWQQKDALYLAAGYAESKIWDVPW